MFLKINLWNLQKLVSNHPQEYKVCFRSIALSVDMLWQKWKINTQLFAQEGRFSFLLLHVNRRSTWPEILAVDITYIIYKRKKSDSNSSFSISKISRSEKKNSVTTSKTVHFFHTFPTTYYLIIMLKQRKVSDFLLVHGMSWEDFCSNANLFW